jgi:hypothetical protein
MPAVKKFASGSSLLPQFVDSALLARFASAPGPEVTFSTYGGSYLCCPGESGGVIFRIPGRPFWQNLGLRLTSAEPKLDVASHLFVPQVGGGSAGPLAGNKTGKYRDDFPGIRQFGIDFL